MSLIDSFEEDNMKVHSKYSFVSCAMAEGLEMGLANPHLNFNIPQGVLTSAKYVLQTAIKAFGDEPPRSPVESAELWSMVSQNLPKELNLEDDRLPEKIDGLAILIGDLKRVKRIPKDQIANYQIIQKIFQSIYVRANNANYVLYMMGTESFADDSE
jgi:hypothetical protein